MPSYHQCMSALISQPRENCLYLTLLHFKLGNRIKGRQGLVDVLFGICAKMAAETIMDGQGSRLMACTMWLVPKGQIGAGSSGLSAWALHPPKCHTICEWKATERESWIDTDKDTPGTNLSPSQPLSWPLNIHSHLHNSHLVGFIVLHWPKGCSLNQLFLC